MRNNYKNLWLCALIALCLAAPAAQALEPGKAFHDYASDTWSLEQGLPQITVLSVNQGAQGYMWFGTQDGIARFDGVTFKQYLPGYWGTVLVNGPDGTLWIGTNKGVAYYEPDQVHMLSAAPGERDVNKEADVRALAFSGERLFAATNLGLVRVDKDGLHHDTTLPKESFYSLLEWRGALWVGGVGKIYIVGSGVKRIDAPGGKDTMVTRLMVHDDALWAGTTRGLFRYTGSEWTRAAGDPPELRLATETFFVDSDGNFWVSTNAGLARLEGDVLQQFIPANEYKAAAQVEAIYEDKEHSLWLGTHAYGVTRLWNGYTQRYTTNEGLGETLTWSVIPNRSIGHGGGTWVGTANGVYLLKDGRFSLVVPATELPAPNAYTLMDDGTRLWIGTNGGLVQYEDGRVLRPAEFAPISGLIVHGLFRDHTGAIWIATLDGVFRYQDGALVRYGMDAGLKDVRSRLIYETHDGRILVGTLAGLYEFDAGRFKPLGGDIGLADAFVTTIAEPANGLMVVGTFNEDALYVYDGSHWHAIHADQGLPPNSLMYMTADAAGEWLWGAGIRGIYRIRIAELTALIQGKLDQLHPQLILSEQGQWPGSEKGLCCNGAGNARGYYDGTRLWLPTRNGVVTVDTRRVHQNDVVPKAVVEALQYSGTWHENVGSTILVPARARDLAFRFSVLSFQNPRSVQLRYRLTGYDQDWQNVEDVMRRDVNYTNLPPGDYTFEVRGSNNAGIWAEAPASLQLRIEPFFYETWWFRILAVLLLALLVLLGYRIQARSLKRQREYLEEVVAERTEALRVLNRQLEDASQTDPLTGLKNRRYLGQQLPSDLAHFRRERERPENSGQVMAFAIADLDHFKEINDRAGHFAGDALLKQVAERLVAGVRAGHYVVRWGGEEFLIVFRPMPQDETARVISRVQKSIGESPYRLPGGEQIQVTCSIGYTEYPFLANAPDRVDWELLVNLADHALYAAKAAGRDRWFGLRPGPKFDARSIRDDLVKGVTAAIKAKKLVMVKEESGNTRKKRAKKPS
ncbi:MAG TPA: diguanylate cyclase [Gammaproteobacteria bacterium]|nr:diguanylate cyclase [Gammaproteobacteria bacterium]